MNTRYSILFFFCLLLLPAFSNPLLAAPQRKEVQHVYVNSPKELKKHFELHHDRVLKLGLALFDVHPEEFPLLTREQVEEFLTLHDRAKLDNTKRFRTRFWKKPTGPSFTKKLYKLYSLGYERVKNDPKLKKIVDQLNETDRKVAYDYFKRHKLLNKDGTLKPEAEQLLRLEHIVDVVDRHTDPVAKEEFHITDLPPPLTKFLRAAKDVALAEEMIPRYDYITQGLSYVEKTKKKQRCQPLEKLADSLAF